MSKKHTPVKNQRERESYHRDSRRQSKMNPTGEYGASSLHGSGDTWEPDENSSDGNNIPVAKPSVMAWIKEHWLESITIPLLVAFIIFAARWIFDKNTEVAVIQQKIETIVERIDKLDSDAVTKEYLDLKIELIKKDMSSLIPDISGIEAQINDVVSRLDNLEANQ